MLRTVIILIAVALAVLPHSGQAKFFTTPVERDITPNHILVHYRDGHFGKVKVKTGESIDDKIAELKQRSDVLQAAPNYKRDVTEIIPDDPKWSEQYSIDTSATGSVQASQAWTITKGKKKVRIAVVDTGVQLNHPDLAKKIWNNSDEIADNNIDDDNNGFVDDAHGWDFVEDDNNPNPTPDPTGDNDGLSHGTHVAGIAAAKTNNTTGMAGVGWKVKIMPIKVSDASGTMTDADVVEGIQYAIDNGATVINLSLGGLGYSSVLDEVVQAAIDQGIVVVAAAGNNHRNMNILPFYPVCSAGVIGVSATDESDAVASFSNFGTNCVDVAAPGVDIVSTIYDDAYDIYSGTSMATPNVAGIAALLKSQDSSLTPAEVLSIIKDTTDDVDLPTAYGTGRVNAVEALLALDSVDYVQIKAYDSSSKDEQFTNGKTYSDRTPYFNWVVPKLLTSNIKGYYVYFGKNKDADPTTKGTFQTANDIAIAKLDKTSQQTYYLKIAVQKGDGSMYNKQGSFTYILSTD